MKIYLVGIKGTGLSALAGILQDDGLEVLGADVPQWLFTEDDLKRRNILIEDIDHIHLPPDAFVVLGHSFCNHPIVEVLHREGIPYLEYHQFLFFYFQNRRQIAVAGTHGKTTTVGMIGDAFYPICMLRGDGTGRGGASPSVVFEACEYQDHFLAYFPEEAVITNIGYDHVDYFKSKKQYHDSFQEFAMHAGKLYIRYGDRKKILHPNMVTFGIRKGDYHYRHVHYDEQGFSGDLYFHETKLLSIQLPIFGKYQAEHVLVTFAIAHQREMNLDTIYQNLAKRKGIKRRITTTLVNDDVLIDDYAHHPHEIDATISIVEQMYPNRKVVVVFKPDRLSRLYGFRSAFQKALNHADSAYVLPSYEIDSKFSFSSFWNSPSIHPLHSVEELLEEREKGKTVYLFVSSKDMSSWENELKSKIQ